jgi:hypothetical protein
MEYFDNLYFDKLENVEEMDKFLNSWLPQLFQKGIRHSTYL